MVEHYGDGILVDLIDAIMAAMARRGEERARNASFYGPTARPDAQLVSHPFSSIHDSILSSA